MSQSVSSVAARLSRLELPLLTLPSLTQGENPEIMQKINLFDTTSSYAKTDYDVQPELSAIRDKPNSPENDKLQDQIEIKQDLIKQLKDINKELKYRKNNLENDKALLETQKKECTDLIQRLISRVNSIKEITEIINKEKNFPDKKEIKIKCDFERIKQEEKEQIETLNKKIEDLNKEIDNILMGYVIALENSSNCMKGLACAFRKAIVERWIPKV